MNMIERVSRAIAEHFSAGERAHGTHVEAARAAIEALREPTEAMVEEGGDRDNLGWDPSPGDVWKAMIAAALGEGE